MSEIEMVTASEFRRTFDGLAAQMAALQVTSQATLVQATKTNGRVDLLEASSKRQDARISDVASESATKRDVRVAAWAIGAAFAVVEWLPRLLALAGGK